MARYGMVIDLTLCMNCRACMIACKTEHQIPAGEKPEYYRMSKIEYEQGKYPKVKKFFAPTLCMQCYNAPCIDICPVSDAIYRRKDGIVIINEEKCNGCKLCIQVCPYNALYFDEEKHIVDKCDFCSKRIDQGLEPACVATCMGRALIFGDLDDPNSEISKMIEKKEVKSCKPWFPTYFNEVFKPSVYYYNNKKPS